MIELHNVGKRFGETWVLRHVDMVVKPGELCGVIGRSGSGKSTLLKCITGFLRLNEGEIRVADLTLTANTPVDSRTVVAIRQKAGMVFQHLNLWPYRTALQNIVEGPIYVRRMSRRRAVNLAVTWADLLGIGSLLDRYPSMLSGGQRQRVAIARAAVMEPQYLLLDEITSALDPLLAGEILDILERLKMRGMGVIFVSHQINFIKHSADLLCFLAGGTFMESGEPQAMLERPRTPELGELIAAIDHGR